MRPLDLRRKPRLKGTSPQVYKGIRYHSRKEANYAMELDLLRHNAKPAGRVTEVKRQYKVPLYVKGKLICNWYCDFLVFFADGREEYHEVKGFETEVWKLKRALFEAIHPTLILKVIR